ncbi:MAG: peptidylprolyl isomerase [Salinisphaera sp.]|jgi:peptidyl-prolyl cis-trans isomerase SurA|nr:peptidylprolyl isomerase [Salinisphaera sp.]
MRYTTTSGLALGLAAFILHLPAAHAQLGGGGLTSFSLGQPAQSQSGPRKLDQIVAVVNDDVILESELDTAVAQIRQRAGSQINRVPPNVLRSQVLDQLIMRQLQIERAKQDKIKVSPSQLQSGLARIAQRNNMNMQQFTQAVSASGMSMKSLRNQIRDEILVSKVRQKEVMDKVSISDADVDQYLKNQRLRFTQDHEYHIREIQIALPDGADSTTVGVARDQLKTLRQKIVSGDLTFAEAANNNSQAEDADNGGDMGWLKGAAVPDSFDSALSGMQTGDVSKVFRGDGGLYLIKLEGERGGNAAPEQKKVMVHEVDVSHILLKPNEIRSDARTRKLAQQIHQRLLAGDDFASLARKYSDDKATANQGGDIGWVPVDQLPPDTRRQVSGLDKGGISRIFQTQDGYEIIKLVGRRDQDQTDQSKRNEARQTLGKQRASEEGNLWLRKLRDEAYVDIRMPDYQPTGSGS